MSLPFQTVGPASIPLKQADNNNLTYARMGMPFKPNTMTQGSDFAAGRLAYIQNAGVTPINSINTTSHSTVTTFAGRPIRFGVSNANLTQQIAAGKKKNYNVSAGERTYLKKINAIGKSSTNTLNTGTMSYSGVDQTSVKDAIVRVRNAGTAAPRKKGAVRTS
jgi:hypothetical protein